MLALDDDDLELLQPWFTPESPGAITIGPHVINTGYGNAWVDRWPEPRAVLVEAATNYVLRGDPGALTGIFRDPIFILRCTILWQLPKVLRNCAALVCCFFSGHYL